MLSLTMDQLGHGFCPHPGCDTYYYDRCLICAPPHLCEAHTPEQFTQRHRTSCGKIREQLALHERLRQEADQPIQTRSGVCVALADETYTLVDMLFRAFYPGPLPRATFDDIIKLLNYEKIQLFWSDNYARLVTPALYIFQNRDQEAYARTIRLMNVEPSRRAFAPPPQVSNSQIARYSMLDDVSIRVHAVWWVFRVPLALIKLRLVLDLRSLWQNPQRLADLRNRQDRGPLSLVENGPIRSHMARLVQEGNLAQRIARLENEIRTLAQFSGWGLFWRFLCYPEHCAWRLQNGTQAIPDAMSDCVLANRYSWERTPGACNAMINLLELR